MRNTLPRNTPPALYERGVVNLDIDKGTHWCAYRKNKNVVISFDSFGSIPPPREVLEYFRGNDIIYNHDAFQSYNSYICGHLCLLFLRLDESDI